MGFLSFFRHKTPESLEQKGDSLVRTNAWGLAKIEYEKALDRLEQSPQAPDGMKARLEKKISRVKDALAQAHQKSAQDMIEAGFYEDARQYIALALDLAGDPVIGKSLRNLARDLDDRLKIRAKSESPRIDVFDFSAEEPVVPRVEIEEFRALLGGLSEEVRQAYLRYGEDFKTGYLALNQGDFEKALAHLTKAMQANPSPDSFIPLELASAYLNLGKTEDARSLLEEFLGHHPNALPAYEMLCEIHWEARAFKTADALLAAVPEDLAESVAVYLLRGNTLFHARNYQEARKHYQHFLKNYGWDERVVKALAETHEALGELDAAQGHYADIIARGQSCRANVEPHVKLKYADISFSLGLYTTQVLELYLSLAREMPANASDCYQKVSRIYAARGNPIEAGRFQRIAEKV